MSLPTTKPQAASAGFVKEPAWSEGCHCRSVRNAAHLGTERRRRGPSALAQPGRCHARGGGSRASIASRGARSSACRRRRRALCRRSVMRVSRSRRVCSSAGLPVCPARPAAGDVAAATSLSGGGRAGSSLWPGGGGAAPSSRFVARLRCSRPPHRALRDSSRTSPSGLDDGERGARGVEMDVGDDEQMGWRLIAVAFCV